MTTIIAKHGKTYTLADGDVIQFGTPLKTTEGDWNAKKHKFAYRWKTAAVCYLVGVERLELVDGTTYRAVAAVEVPSEVPSTPAPPPTSQPIPFRTASIKVIDGLEKYASNGRLNVGFSVDGSIGTSHNDGPPAAFATDLKNGFKRLGIFVKQPEGAKYIDDIAIHARSPGGFVVEVNGKTYANETLNGWHQIPGVWASDTLWSGGKDGLVLNQSHGFTEAGELFLDITAENATDASMDMTHVWVIDPDTSSSNPGGTANFSTTQKVTAPGKVECLTSQGATFTLSCDDPAAHVRITSWDKAYILGTERPVGYTKKGDETVQVGVRATLPPRGKKAWRVLMGVTVA